MLKFTGERIVPEADNCEPLFATKMYQEHIARYLFASQKAGGRSVLDVGCGVGYGSQLLARRGASRVTAFDVSEEAIRHARQFYAHPRAQYLVSSAEDFQSAGHFDLITCFELIEHVEHQHRVLQRLQTALTDDGLLFISTPQPRGENRSAFHVRELSYEGFSNLLACYFPHIEFFFENNHFASLVAGNAPDSVQSVHVLHPQFGLGQADYFVAVASRSPINRDCFREQLVLNNDAYVRRLEGDVEVLHKIEGDLKNQLEAGGQTPAPPSKADGHELDGNRERIATLDHELELAIAKEKALEAECGAAQAELALMRNSNEASERKTREHIESLTGELERTVRREGVLNADLAAAKAELGFARQINEKSEQQAREQIASLTREFEMMLAQSDELRRVVDAAAKANAVHTEQSQAQQKAINSMRKQLAAGEAELQRRSEQSKQRFGALMEEVSRAREQSAALKDERDRLQSLVTSYEVRLRAITSSRSWQLTTPLRTLATALRGHAHDPFGIASLGNGHAIPPSDVQVSLDLRNSNHKEGHAPSHPFFDVLYIIGSREGESKRYRAHNLVEGLSLIGFRSESWPQEEVPVLIRERFSAKVVVFFRCGYDGNIEDLLSYCAKNKILSIFDVDDLVFEPENVKFVRVVDTFSRSDRAAYLHGVERFRKTLLNCDRATCTTTFLARRINALGKRADVIPNSLNSRQIDIARIITSSVSKNVDQVRIGYFSGSNTHQIDFEACEIALLSVMDRFPEVRFVLVGILDLGSHWDRFADRIDRHPLMPYHHMLAVLAGTDINLAPLEMGNPYCESKSQLKIFEAGLVHVPTVASAVESYTEAIDDGVDGFLASTPSEWVSALDQLVQSRELRARVGEQAYTRALDQFGPEASLRKAVEVYGLPAAHAPTAPVNDQRLKISWIIPKLQIGSGGHRNILRTAYYLEKFGHQLELYFTDSDLKGENLKRAVREHFYQLECPMHVYEGSINPTDVLFATHWLTVEPVVRAREAARELMYFVQDFEPAFAPMGTEYILAENTYRLGLYHITSGPWCENLLKREFGVEADHFKFPVDRRIYYPRERQKWNKNLVFFARPEMPRRCFELGVMALEAFHRMKPDVEIILFGSRKVEGMPLPFPATVQSLVPTIDDLAQLYANADLGVVFSTTNPSLVPYEMMACGLPVVDLGRPGNELNYGGKRDIALLADPAPTTMARQICELIENSVERVDRSRKGLEFVQTFPSEEEMVRRVEELILKRVALKNARTISGSALASRNPYVKQ